MNITITGMQLAVTVIGMTAVLSIAMIGKKGVESIGRNPGAFTSILVFGVLAMAFAEGLALLVYFAVNK